MPYKLKDPYRHKFNKSQYHLSNWPKYNQTLKYHGNINIWFTQDIIEGWYHKPGQKKAHGRQKNILRVSNKYHEIIRNYF